jgi:hypothetical protein
MSIVVMVLLILVVPAIGLMLLRDALQREQNQRGLARLRANNDTLVLRTAILDESLESRWYEPGEDEAAWAADRFTVMATHTIEDGEVLVGRGFLVPVDLYAPRTVALYNPAVLPEGLKGITWSIPMDTIVIRGDSLVVEHDLSKVASVYDTARLTFKGLLAGGRRAAIVDALGVNKEACEQAPAADGGAAARSAERDGGEAPVPPWPSRGAPLKRMAVRASAVAGLVLLAFLLVVFTFLFAYVNALLLIFLCAAPFTIVVAILVQLLTGIPADELSYRWERLPGWLQGVYATAIAVLAMLMVSFAAYVISALRDLGKK